MTLPSKDKELFLVTKDIGSIKKYYLRTFVNSKILKLNFGLDFEYIGFFDYVEYLKDSTGMVFKVSSLLSLEQEVELIEELKQFVLENVENSEII